MELPAIPTTTKTGEEAIVHSEKQRTLLDFWRWAYSDIIGNTERGVLAEYLVALACGIDDKIRIGWDSYDLELANGIKVEVKSSAYLQSWKQPDFSKPSFGIAKTYAWDSKENLYEKVRRRQCDVYVFALLAHKDQDTLNPLEVTQWEFYVLSKAEIDNKAGDAKQISLKKLQALGAGKCDFGHLQEGIRAAGVSI